MKKTLFLSLILISIIAFIISCRHVALDSGAGTGVTITPLTPATCSPDTAYFQQQVLPIFISNCALSGCHDAITRQHGVNLTTYQSIITTGNVRPFEPGNSDIWKKINATNLADRMPPLPRNALSQAQKDIIFKWITQGAKNNSCQASACDSTNVTFSGIIKPIMSTNCLGCHSGPAPQAGINYSTYAGVKAKVDDGRLWGAINHFTGFSPMPKGGAKLSDCEIRQFKKWIDAGAPNN